MGSLLILILLVVVGVLVYVRSQRDRPGSRLFSLGSSDVDRSPADEWGNGGWIVQDEPELDPAPRAARRDGAPSPRAGAEPKPPTG